MFQIVREELGSEGRVIARRPLLPLYEIFEDAMALAEFDASRCDGAYGYDAQHDWWWARERGRRYRFVIEEVAPASLAS